MYINIKSFTCDCGQMFTTPTAMNNIVDEFKTQIIKKFTIPADIDLKAIISPDLEETATQEQIDASNAMKIKVEELKANLLETSQNLITSYQSKHPKNTFSNPSLLVTDKEVLLLIDAEIVESIVELYKDNIQVAATEDFDSVIVKCPDCGLVVYAASK